MVEAYNIYNLYKKQRRRKGTSASWEDVIPTVFSIDGDGTMQEVIVKSNATECGYGEEYDPIYKWEDADDNDDFICDECSLEPETDYYDQYLTIEALDSGSIKWSGTTTSNTVSYSINNGTWSTLSRSFTLHVSTGDKVRFRGSLSGAAINDGIGYFSGTTILFDVYGNAHSLLYSDDFVGNDKLKGTYTFKYLFNKTNVVDASNLILPATTLANFCYSYMFEGCTSLRKIPKLPATTLADSCYSGMFNGCESLREAPELPATTLADSCYSGMFNGCTSLQEAPELPATTLANWCYQYMFQDCTSLTKAPELPATTLADSCYSGMFNGCNKIQEAPVLPATTLARWCYSYMFEGCSKIQEAPVLPATTLADSCYYGMLRGCRKLEKAPELPATELVGSCYSRMFQDCTSLQEAPELPATTLANFCYSYMFEGCTSLTKAPELPATTLAEGCYYYMFYDCSILTKGPKLPATKLVKNCYYYMFNGCMLINEITTMQLDAPNSVSQSQYYWIEIFAKTGTIYLNKDITWDPEKYRGPSGIPEGWTVIKI